MINEPGQDMQHFPQGEGPLVLPPVPGQGPYSVFTASTDQTHQFPPLRPEQMIRPEQLIRHPQGAKAGGSLASIWKDPAYRILFLAIALVLVASIFFVALGVNALQNTNGKNNNGSQIANLTTATVIPTATPSPTPTATPSPTPLPTPSPTPTPANSFLQGGPLQVQIVSVPSSVSNNSKVRVTVETSEPGVEVALRAQYNAVPFVYQSSTHTTDNSGSVTISWSVKVYTFQSMAQAQLVVVARDQNGQEATSQPVTVTIQS